jgi:protein SCO1
MRHRLLLAAAAAALLSFGAGLAIAHDMQHMTMGAPAGPTSASLYNLESTWTNEDGASVALSALSGKPVVAAMGYTSCKDMCPAIVADMMWIEKHLPQDASGRVRFAFFSIDSKVDTPAKLKAYADEHGFDPARWMLLHGDDDAIRELAAALGVGYRPDGQGGFDHAAVISLIDDKGEIVFQQRGTQASSDEVLAALTSLLEKRN